MSGDLQALVKEAYAKSYKLEAKTHCPQGHEYTEQTTLWHTRPNGRRTKECRLCEAARRARNRAQRDAEEFHTDPNHLCNVAGLENFLAKRRARGIPKEGLSHETTNDR